ncbi:MAG: response regulator [Deltaproteobacteria bacterium]
MFGKILLAVSGVEERDRFYEIFFKQGHKVDCVPNTNELRLRLGDDRPDIIIMHEKFRPAGGIAALEAIREVDKDVKAVLMTEKEPDRATVEKALLLGASAVFKTDFSDSAMISSIVALMNGEEAFRRTAGDISRVLVVDDNAEVRNVLAQFLSRRGFTVREAANGDQALLEVNQDRPELVLLDQRMPGMDGLVVLKKIKEIDSRILVVMLTAVEDADVQADAKALGVSGFMLKPCDFRRLELLLYSIQFA